MLRVRTLTARLRTTLAVTLASAAVALAAAGTAGAAGIVPVEGPWVGTTSAGLPVSFEVREGNVVDAHFRFKWGFCGTFESHTANTDPIDTEGHWSFLDIRGQTIAGTFVAPDRVEGTVDAVERMLPSCPHTHATFVAAPGEIPPHLPPQLYAVQNANTVHLSRRPREIVLEKGAPLYLYGLHWQSFGGKVATADGRAHIQRGKRVWTPRATVRLNFPIPDGPDRKVYSFLRYTLHGPVPAGFRRQGVETYG